MKQRKWTAEEKLAIVLEGLKEKLREFWANLRLDPLFTLDYVCFYDV